MNREEITNIIYDTLFGNTQYEQFDLDEVTPIYSEYEDDDNYLEDDIPTQDDAWGRLMSYDPNTELYTVQWPDGHTSEHHSYELMTIEKANEANRRYWEGNEDY